MLKSNFTLAKIGKWVISVLGKTILYLFLFLLVISVGIQLPFIQKAVISEVVQFVSSKTDHRIEIGRVNIDWFDQGVLKNIKVYDYQDSIMAEVRKVQVDFNLLKLIDEGAIRVDKLEMKKGSLHLANYPDSLGLNLVHLLSRIKDTFGGEESESEDSSTPLTIKGIHVDDFKVSLNDYEKEKLSEEGKLDPAHLDFKLEELDISRIKVRKDTIFLDLTDLRGAEIMSGLTIMDFSTKIRLTRKRLVLKEFKLKTPDSQLGDSIVFHFDHPEDLGDFMTKVRFGVFSKNSRLSTKDLNRFVDTQGMEGVLNISAGITGSIDDVSIGRLRLKYNDSHFRAVGRLTGMPDLDQTFVDLKIEHLHANSQELVRWLPENLPEIGNLDMEGSITGTKKDLQVETIINIPDGEIQSSLHLSIPDDVLNTAYDGKLSFQDFDLGSLLSDTTMVGTVNFAGDIDGYGLDPEKAEFFLNATLDSSEIMNYRYNHLKITGQFADNYFAGNFSVDDPNLKVNGLANMNLNVDKQYLRLFAGIDTLNLDELNLSSDDIALSSKINLDIQNLSVNNAVGFAYINDTYLKINEQEAGFDKIRISSQKDSIARHYEIEAPGVKADINGSFAITQLGQDLLRVFEEYLAFFDYRHRLDYHSIRKDTLDYYKADFDISITDLSQYLKFVDSTLYVSPCEIEMTYNQKRDAHIDFFLEVDTLSIGDQSLFGNTIEIDASKDANSSDLLAIAYISSESQQLGDVPQTSNFVAECLWFNNELAIEMDLEQESSESSFSTGLDITFYSDSVFLKFRDSDIIALGKPWTVNDQNFIKWYERRMQVNDLEVLSGQQSMRLDGVFSDSVPTSVSMAFKEINLNLLSTFLPKKLDGVLNGQGIFIQESQESPFYFISDVAIDELRFEDLLAGNLRGITKWSNKEEGLNFSFNMEREQIKTIEVKGIFRPLKKEDQLNVQVSFDRANLNLLEPLLVGTVSNIEGVATGNVEVKGNLSEPVLTGSSKLSEGSFTMDYFNTTYGYEGEVVFEEDVVKVNEVKLTDRFGKRGKVNGEITHRSFQNFMTNINLEFNELEVMNTTILQNSLFYGNAFGTGTASITGPLDNLLISCSASSNAGTKMYIPVTYEGQVVEHEYIKMVNFSEALDQTSGQEDEVNLSGIGFDFLFDVTPDAYVELIFDPKSGDIIRGRARGNMHLVIDADGEFNLYGSVEVEEGAYNFTLANLGINKEFDVRPGGTITWYGDPYNGVLNLEALYRQMATPDDWRPPPTGEAGTARQPVQVVLSLDGNMFSPDITFGIELENESLLNSDGKWSELITNLNNQANEQELNRQVFSLLMLRRFSPESSFVTGGGSLESSVSEFLSNQLSYWINQVDENLEVDFDLAGLDSDAFNTFQMRLSYSFLNGRLRVTRSGGFASSANDPNSNGALASNVTSSLNDILGDWSVEYMLTADGRLRAKVFSRADQTNLSSAAGTVQNSNLNQETGVSLQYIRSFDEFKELIGNARNDALSN